MLRLFFALQPTSAQAADLLARAGPLIEQLRAQRVAVENLHATLCFIGAVAREKLDSLREAAARVRGPPARLRFDALDYWSKPRILCATAQETRAAATHLAAALANATVAAGFAPDVKPFRAHLTLARKVRAAEAAKVEWPQVLTPPLDVRCDRFMLMQSRREASGSIYSVVDSWPLDADESQQKTAE